MTLELQTAWQLIGLAFATIAIVAAVFKPPVKPEKPAHVCLKKRVAKRKKK